MQYKCNWNEGSVNFYADNSAQATRYAQGLAAEKHVGVDVLTVGDVYITTVMPSKPTIEHPSESGQSMVCFIIVIALALFVCYLLSNNPELFAQWSASINHAIDYAWSVLVWNPPTA